MTLTDPPRSEPRPAPPLAAVRPARRATVVTRPADAVGLGTVLGIWAHPDDEAYLSAGLMSLARAAGNDVVCVTATAGDHGTDDPVRFPPSRLVPIRRREMAAAMAALDVRHHRFLDLEDGTLADLDPAPHVRRLRDLVVRHEPDTIVTFGPDGITGHPDHVAVSRWTTAAWRESGCDARLLHATTTSSFADEFAPLHAQLPVFGEGLPLRTPDAAVDLRVRVEGEHLDRKMAALHAHASQVRVLVDTFGHEAFRAWWRSETFVEARPA